MCPALKSIVFAAAFLVHSLAAAGPEAPPAAPSVFADSFGQNAPAGISATSSANPQAAQAPVPVADSFGLNRGIAANCPKAKAVAQPAAKAQKC